MENTESKDSIISTNKAKEFFLWTALSLILVKFRGLVFVKIFSTYLGAYDYGYFFFIQNTSPYLSVSYPQLFSILGLFAGLILLFVLKKKQKA